MTTQANVDSVLRQWLSAADASALLLHNEQAIVWLAAANILPDEVTFVPTCGVCTTPRQQQAKSRTHLYTLHVYTACCHVRSSISEDDRVALSMLPRNMHATRQAHRRDDAINEATRRTCTSVAQHAQRMHAVVHKAHSSACLFMRHKLQRYALRTLLHDDVLCLHSSLLVRARCAALHVGTAPLLLPLAMSPLLLALQASCTVLALGAKPHSSHLPQAQQQPELHYVGGGFDARLARLLVGAKRGRPADEEEGKAVACRNDDDNHGGDAQGSGNSDQGMAGLAPTNTTPSFAQRVAPHIWLLLHLYGYALTPLCSAHAKATHNGNTNADTSNMGVQDEENNGHDNDAASVLWQLLHYCVRCRYCGAHANVHVTTATAQERHKSRAHTPTQPTSATREKATTAHDNVVGDGVAACDAGEETTTSRSAASQATEELHSNRSSSSCSCATESDQTTCSLTTPLCAHMHASTMCTTYTLEVRLQGDNNTHHTACPWRRFFCDGVIAHTKETASFVQRVDCDFAMQVKTQSIRQTNNKNLQDQDTCQTLSVRHNDKKQHTLRLRFAAHEMRMLLNIWRHSARAMHASWQRQSRQQWCNQQIGGAAAVRAMHTLYDDALVARTLRTALRHVSLISKKVESKVSTTRKIGQHVKHNCIAKNDGDVKRKKETTRTPVAMQTLLGADVLALLAAQTTMTTACSNDAARLLRAVHTARGALFPLAGAAWQRRERDGANAKAQCAQHACDGGTMRPALQRLAQHMCQRGCIAGTHNAAPLQVYTPHASANRVATATASPAAPQGVCCATLQSPLAVRDAVLLRGVLALPLSRVTSSALLHATARAADATVSHDATHTRSTTNVPNSNTLVKRVCDAQSRARQLLLLQSQQTHLSRASARSVACTSRDASQATLQQEPAVAVAPSTSINTNSGTGNDVVGADALAPISTRGRVDMPTHCALRVGHGGQTIERVALSRSRGHYNTHNAHAHKHAPHFLSAGRDSDVAFDRNSVPTTSYTGRNISLTHTSHQQQQRQNIATHTRRSGGGIYTQHHLQSVLPQQASLQLSSPASTLAAMLPAVFGDAQQACLFPTTKYDVHRLSDRTHSTMHHMLHPNDVPLPQVTAPYSIGGSDHHYPAMYCRAMLPQDTISQPSATLCGTSQPHMASDTGPQVALYDTTTNQLALTPSDGTALHTNQPRSIFASPSQQQSVLQAETSTRLNDEQGILGDAYATTDAVSGATAQLHGNTIHTNMARRGRAPYRVARAGYRGRR